MIEREVRVAVGAQARRRRHLQPAGANIALGIDATTRYAVKNWTEPLKRAKSTARPLQHAERGPAADPDRSPGLASIKAAAAPSRSSYLYYVVRPAAAAATTSRPPTPSSRRTAPPTTRRSGAPAAIRPRRTPRAAPADERVPAAASAADPDRPWRLGVFGWPVAHSRSPAMQAPRSTRSASTTGPTAHSPCRRRGSTRRWPRCRAPASRGRTSRSRTRRRRSRCARGDRDGAGDRRREHADVRSRRGDRGRQHRRPGDLAASATSARAAALMLGAGGAPAPAPGRCARPGAGVAVWNRTAARARELAGDLGSTP